MNKVKLLQVFNQSQPCGWLGYENGRFWFHYSSQNMIQPWLSLLMPPTTNFYSRPEPFPIISNLIQAEPKPERVLTELLEQSGQQLGHLTFANPDAPVLKPRITLTLDSLERMNFSHLRESLDIRKSLDVGVLVSTQKQFNLPEWLAYPSLPNGLLESLSRIKNKADPDNKVPALRWLTTLEKFEQITLLKRPDMNHPAQIRLGFEPLESLLGLSSPSFRALLKQKPKQIQRAIHELIRTYCRQMGLEIKILDACWPLIQNEQLLGYVAYEQPLRPSHEKPRIYGLDFLPRLPRSGVD